MLRFLLINICIVFGLTACSLKTTEGLRQLESTKAEVINPYFSNPEIDYVYKAKIEAYGRNFGGILIVKKMEADHHRIVMTTELGNKLLDLQFKNGVFSENFVIEELDRKMILNVLKADFRLLLMEKSLVLNSYDSETQHVYQTQRDNRYNFYFVSKDDGKLEQIRNTSKSKEKVVVDFHSETGKEADSIFIKHKNMKLYIDLNKFKDE